MVLSGDKHQEPLAPQFPDPGQELLLPGQGLLPTGGTPGESREGGSPAGPLVVFGHGGRGSPAVDLIHSRSLGGGWKWAASERLRCGPVSVTSAGQAGTGRRAGDGNDPAVSGR